MVTSCQENILRGEKKFNFFRKNHLLWFANLPLNLKNFDEAHSIQS